ncbi:PRAME family member 8 isoform X1 [Cricetulus griseus]|uniref:PRAME family member 8 isoform X2 n=1 Tax=Cricetulus griseus TaxID=10029 RepID=G3IKK8_CRIGR|nr:PRAME family member 8 isoform X1 [Cricetulus griseus]XP_027254802.1 PRAME family member 8 isoform X2 [Cricetulus griseus]EGW10054.1 Putative PRAME family member 24 [Cricetulus griseus]
MSGQAPPILMQLAVQSLLRDETVAVSALQQLPRVLFPPVFKEAFNHRQTNILRAMVAVWPFPCLPVGSLMRTPHLETLQAVLDGVDMLWTQKFLPRKRKLQVLDLRSVHHGLWDICAGVEEGGACSQETVCEKKQTAKPCPRYALRQRLKVVANLCLRFHLNEHQTYLLQWAQQRRSFIRLCCVKMQIWALPVYTVRKVLMVFQPDSIQELELNTGWSLSALVHFVSYLDQMRNLQKLLLTRSHKNTFKVLNTPADIQKCITKFVSQFSKLNCLQHLSMNGIYFASEHMKQLFRYLKTPLETLSITMCKLSQLDLNSLSQSKSLHQLKHLNLRLVKLNDLYPVPFHDLLKSVADTLKTLELEGCWMVDSQLITLLPALSQCSQLTRVSFYDNDISMAVLKDLLYHTANLRQLTQELYPAPLECYDDRGDVHLRRFTQLCSELVDTLITVRQPKGVSFATYVCHECCQRCVYDLETRLCRCRQ